MGEEPAVLASCLSFARWDSTVWSGGLPGPMKAVVVRNTILILDSGRKGLRTLLSLLRTTPHRPRAPGRLGARTGFAESSMPAMPTLQGVRIRFGRYKTSRPATPRTRVRLRTTAPRSGRRYPSLLGSRTGIHRSLRPIPEVNS